MEKSKDLSWNERHPNGNLSHHTFLDGFDGLTMLNEEETKVALRVLKAHLENELKFEISDSLFANIFKSIPYLALARPLCMFSNLHGFILPLKRILEAHNALDENWRENVSIIMGFFKVGGRAYSISIQSDL